MVSGLETQADVCIRFEIEQVIVSFMNRNGKIPRNSRPAAGKDGRTSRNPISESRKKEIDKFYISMKGKTFYEILGVGPNADRSQIRMAYFALSKQFHPDTAFTAEAGNYKHKMEIIFRGITKAYDVLSHKGRRSEYDDYIREDLKLLEMRQKMVEAQAMAQQAAKSTSVEAQLALREIGKNDRFHIDEEDLDEYSGSLQPEVSREHFDDIRSQWVKERTGNALLKLLSRGRKDWRRVRLNRVEEYIETAERAVAANNHLEAVTALKVALGFMPYDKRLKKLYEEQSRALSLSMARSRAKQGRYELRNGESAEALENFRQAVELDPENIEYRHLAAQSVLDSGQNPQEALDLSEEGLSIKPDGRLYSVMGEAFAVLGNYQEAERAYAFAIDNDSGNREYKKRLKEIKKQARQQKK